MTCHSNTRSRLRSVNELCGVRYRLFLNAAGLFSVAFYGLPEHLMARFQENIYCESVADGANSTLAIVHLAYNGQDVATAWALLSTFLTHIIADAATANESIDFDVVDGLLIQAIS